MAPASRLRTGLVAITGLVVVVFLAFLASTSSKATCDLSSGAPMASMAGSGGVVNDAPPSSSLDGTAVQEHASAAVANTAAAAGSTAPPRRHKRVISMSVFVVGFHRDSTDEEIERALATGPSTYITRYSSPTFNVILNYRFLLPDWIVRVYVPRGFPLAQKYRNCGAEVVEMDFDPRLWIVGMMWRFLPEDDPEVEFWASRESDSPPTYQDSAALQHWVKSGYPVHAILMRQLISWTGGAYGFRGGFLTQKINTTVAESIVTYRDFLNRTGRASPFGSKYNDDQHLMASWLAGSGVYAGAEGVRLQRDAIGYVHLPKSWNRTCQLASCVEFPEYPGKPEMDFRPADNKIDAETAILCHYREPPYCRRQRYGRTSAWRELYELCTGRDFDTDEPITGTRLGGMTECPYKGLAPLPLNYRPAA